MLIYLCQLQNDNSCVILNIFKNEQEMIKYFAFDYKYAGNTRYNNMLANQQLTGNDMMRYYTGYDTGYNDNDIAYAKRLLILLTADSDKIIDIRNYETTIAKESNAISMTDCQKRTYKSKIRTGKAHKKSHSCKSIKNNKLHAKLTDKNYKICDEDYNIKKRKDYYNYDRYKICDMQNNWKSAKIKKQYAWHAKNL